MKECLQVMYGDMTRCDACDLTWDTNDSDAPKCLTPDERIEKKLVRLEKDWNGLRLGSFHHFREFGGNGKRLDYFYYNVKREARTAVYEHKWVEIKEGTSWKWKLTFISPFFQ